MERQHISFRPFPCRPSKLGTLQISLQHVKLIRRSIIPWMISLANLITTMRKTPRVVRSNEISDTYVSKYLVSLSHLSSGFCSLKTSLETSRPNVEGVFPNDKYYVPPNHPWWKIHFHMGAGDPGPSTPGGKIPRPRMVMKTCPVIPMRWRLSTGSSQPKVHPDFI